MFRNTPDTCAFSGTQCIFCPNCSTVQLSVHFYERLTRGTVMRTYAQGQYVLWGVQERCWRLLFSNKIRISPHLYN